jgi:hypothetical protein
MRDGFEAYPLRVSQPDKIIRIERGENAGQKNQNAGYTYEKIMKMLIWLEHRRLLFVGVLTNEDLVIGQETNDNHKILMLWDGVPCPQVLLPHFL